MSGNKEVITGSDFKRMVMGAYSEFLLEYENINALRGGGTLPGTHVLRTMAAAVQPLADTKDDGIGGLSRRVATAAVFGARGQAAIVGLPVTEGLALQRQRLLLKPRPFRGPRRKNRDQRQNA